MDNFTHSLIGAAIGEAAHQLAPGPTPRRRKLFLWASLAGNNFPDLDFLYTWITPGTIGYLLHHRGHTHTLVAIVPQTLLCLALLWGWTAWRRVSFNRFEWQAVAILLAGGMAVHIGADWMNFYGVHPFWPLDNRWYYGDSVFIIEPTLWCFLVGLYVGSPRPLWRKVALVLPCLLAPLLGIFLGFVLWQSLLFCLILLGIFAGASQALSPQTRSITALIGILVFFGGSLGLSHLARSQSQRYVTAHRPELTVEELIVDPVPANPLCWSYLLLLSDQTTLMAEAGVASLAPSLLPAAMCPRRYRPEMGVPLDTQVLPSTSAFFSFGSYRIGKTELAAMDRESCLFRAFLRFSRVPYLDPDQFTDLRFALTSRENFTSLPRHGTKACPEWVPNWSPPRKALLRPE